MPYTCQFNKNAEGVERVFAFIRGPHSAAMWLHWVSEQAHSRVITACSIYFCHALVIGEDNCDGDALAAAVSSVFAWLLFVQYSFSASVMVVAIALQVGIMAGPHRLGLEGEEGYDDESDAAACIRKLYASALVPVRERRFRVYNEAPGSRPGPCTCN